MSDSFTDVYREDWRPKGFGWWSDEKKKEFLEARLNKNIDEVGYWMECHKAGLINREFFAEKYQELK